MPSKPKILILVNHYLPGFHYGGPTRSIVNLIEWLGDDFDFFILTKDRDLNSNVPYLTISYGKWNAVGKAHVRYLTPQEQQLTNLARIYRQIDYDSLYLNVVFSALTIETLSLYRTGLLPRKPVILASRGTLNPSALNLKSRKKSFFLDLARKTGLYKNLVWHATSPEEVIEIQNVFGSKIANQVYCVENLPSPIPQLATRVSVNKIPGTARIVYLSRIDPKKNLHFALECLSQIEKDVEFDIYGPIKDEKYWQECQLAIQALPSNIRVNYMGAVDLDAVADVLQQYHLFFLPTLNENFGHTILEALCAGCPILISDRTPWKTNKVQSIGWVSPLEKPELFVNSICELIDMDTEAFAALSENARDFGRNYINSSTSVEDMRKFLHDVSM
ncbi:MAG: glycosyltransferase family 4 protein [Anaerolinea sp.]|nr:glycosyltransferase family 4 protein [Anaerolinea sp.]